MEYKLICKNKKQWNSMSEKELNDYKNEIFLYYRKHGFPYYPTDDDFKIKNYKKLINYPIDSLFSNKEKSIQQVMTGLNLAWSYFPHSYSIPCNNLKTPLDVFLNDNLFKKVIDRRIKYGDNISDSGIRKTLKIFSGTQCVSNFRPTAAACLYNMFAENGAVWDMSCGFGGRLFGFLVSKARVYIGTEPATKTFNGLMKIYDDYYRLYSQVNGYDKDIFIYNHGSETMKLWKNALDFCFTSPPYFDTEKYSDEKSQSYIKYPTKEEWLNGFLYDTFKKAYIGLKKDKYMAINICNVKSFPNLEEETIRIAKSVGFTYSDTYYYLLSSLSSKNKYKKEPIFIFQKR